MNLGGVSREKLRAENIQDKTGKPNFNPQKLIIIMSET